MGSLKPRFLRINKKLDILILEDNPLDVELIRHELKKEKILFDSHVEASEQAFREAFQKFNPDLILANYSLPDFDA